MNVVFFDRKITDIDQYLLTGEWRYEGTNSPFRNKEYFSMGVTRAHLYKNCQSFSFLSNPSLEKLTAYKTGRKAEVCKFCLHRFERDNGFLPDDDLTIEPHVFERLIFGPGGKGGRLK